MAGASKSAAQVRLRSACRVCGTPDPTAVLDMPPLPITGAFLRSPDEAEFLHPIALYLCETCRAVQSQHDISFEAYYGDYAYTIASSGFARNFAERLAATMCGSWSLRPGSRVLEIGSADGVQLACFRDRGLGVWGVEPSRVLSDAARLAGIPTTTALFGRGTADLIPPEMKPFGLVLLTHVFDHLPEPGEFLRDLSGILDPVGGLLLLEVHDLDETIRHLEYPLIQHEHTTYLTAAGLQRVLARSGLVLVEVGVLPSSVKRAHSLMVLAAPAGSRHAVRAMPDLPLGPLADPDLLRAFGTRLHETLGRVRSYLARRRREGARLAGFGAGGRGIMTLAATAGPADLAYVCDTSPAHHGELMAGSRIRVAGPDEVERHPVDEVIVFSYGYMDEIRRTLASHLARGGRVTSLLDILDGSA